MIYFIYIYKIIELDMLFKKLKYNNSMSSGSSDYVWEISDMIKAMFKGDLLFTLDGTD